MYGFYSFIQRIPIRNINFNYERQQSFKYSLIHGMKNILAVYPGTPQAVNNKNKKGKKGKKKQQQQQQFDPDQEQMETKFKVYIFLQIFILFILIDV